MTYAVRGVHCHKCQYTLRGLNPIGRCPECGELIKHSMSAERAKFCVTCRYDLRGLDPNGKCPECGEPITRACVGCRLDLRRLDPKGYCPRCGVPITPVPEEQRLHNADPDWLAAIDRALTLVRLGFFGVLIGFAVLVLPSMWFTLGSMAFGFGSPPTWVSVIVTVISYCGLALWAFSWLPIFYGLWTLATPEPQPPVGLAAHDRALRVLTMLAIPALVLPPVIVFAAIIPLRAAGLSWPAMIVWAFEVPCMLVFVLHARVFTQYLENMERRSGRLRAKRARVLAQYRKAPLGWGMFALFYLMIILFAYPAHSGSVPISAFPISGWVYLVWFLGLGLVGRTRLAIRQGIADPEGAYVVDRESLPTA